MKIKRLMNSAQIIRRFLKLSHPTKMLEAIKMMKEKKDLTLTAVLLKLMKFNLIIKIPNKL